MKKIFYDKGKITIQKKMVYLSISAAIIILFSVIAQTMSNNANDLIGEIENRYDHEALIKRVLESQRRRRFLKNIMRDQSISWDYQHVENGGDAYIRNTMPIYQLEKKSRFPQV